MAVAVDQADVLHLRRAGQLDAVVPALLREVGEPAAPLLDQVGTGERGEPVEVARVPRRLHVPVEPLGLRAHALGRERLVLVGGHGGGELDRAHALPPPLACPQALDQADHEHDEERRDHEQDDHGVTAAGARAAAGEPAAATTAEAGAAAARGGEGEREERHRSA